jgi:predicted transcriptional regulator
MHSKKMTGRKCYDHLGGKLGAELLEFYLSQEWIKLDEGKSTVYVITEKGYDEFKKIGLLIERDGEDANTI